MQEISLVVTEVTRMHNRHFCVAGWSLQRQRMIRPMPRYGYWTRQDLEVISLEPGATIAVTQIEDASSDFPHRTEDMIVLQLQVRLLAPPPFNWFGPERPPIFASLAAAFGTSLHYSTMINEHKKGNYVEAGSRVRSLIGLELSGAALSFYDHTFEGKAKLRVRLADPSGVYDLPVVAERLLQIYERQGLGALRRQIGAQPKVHVRIGLARPWAGHENQCNLMLNGVHW